MRYTARLTHSPTADLRGAIKAPQVTHTAAITKAKEAGALTRRIAAYDGHAVTMIALRLSPHVFVRPGELRRWEWDESIGIRRSGTFQPRR